MLDFLRRVKIGVSIGSAGLELEIGTPKFFSLSIIGGGLSGSQAKHGKAPNNLYVYILMSKTMQLF